MSVDEFSEIAKQMKCCVYFFVTKWTGVGWIVTNQRLVVATHLLSALFAGNYEG